MAKNSNDSKKSQAINEKNVQEAMRLLETEKQKRAEQAAAAFESLCKEFNVDFVPTMHINGNPVPAAAILAVPIGLNIIPR